MEQAKYDVFISYSRKDYVDESRNVVPGNKVSKIKDALTSAGFSYWFDEEGIYSGQEFTSIITKAIRTSRVFVFVSSKYSNASLWTSNEIAIARRLNKPIIPFCLDESPYNDSVMMLIATLDFIDGREEDKACTKLIRAIHHYVDTNKESQVETIEVPKEATLQKTESKKSKRKLRKIIGFVILPLIIIVPSLIFLKSNPRMKRWYYEIFPSNFPELNMKELSTGKLYGMHEAVDLGLSVKWATCNIGARAPQESGDFFAWGESDTKDYFDWINYKYGECSYDIKDLKKYCTNSAYGAVDNLTVLCDSDDAARMVWGNGWRMPTYDEISELKENCTFEKKSLNGINGVAVTGPNNKTIFIPFAGDVEGDKHIPDGEGAYAILWSSSLNEENNYAYELAFSIAENLWYRGPRFTGHNIRAVHE